MVNVKEFVSSKYLSAANDGKELNGNKYIIDTVFPEVINNEKKLCMRLKGVEKPFVFNQTNINILSTEFGEDSDSWVGKKVMIVVVNTTFKGEVKKGLQVNPA